MKTVKGYIPYEAICKHWTKEPDHFISDPTLWVGVVTTAQKGSACCTVFQNEEGLIAEFIASRITASATEGSNTGALMLTSFRRCKGVGAPESCPKASGAEAARNGLPLITPASREYILKLIRTLKRDGFSLTAYRALVEIRHLALKKLSLLQGKTFIKTYYGVMMKANWGDITFEACVKGHYGRFLSDYLTTIDSKFVFLDIGANQGLYSLIAASNPRCKQILSFEPVNSTFNILKENIDNIERRNIITPFNFAISSQDGSAQIGKEINQSGLASLNSSFNLPDSETIILRKPDFISKYIRAGERIVIKIDTEGHEQTIIDQLAVSPFLTQIESIFYEVDERWVSPASLEARARDIGLTKIMKVGTGTHYDVLASR